MVEITKQEMELLIKKGFLRCTAGKYKNLVICSKRKKQGGKTRYVTEPIADKLRYCR
ncbi:hypothetical protein [Dehalobacter sp. TeCB1]|jgi:hypothetical protein|uniref:hypothetical protein n=1 Tax=Dehalobacter sp. TeCB1 TaxID=1843715 RepID=UPI00159F22E3|nr:hypothetical protein [Dehalobacter sp. TeCB1]